MKIDRILTFVFLLSSIAVPASLLADWPEYRGDQQRTAYRHQKIVSTHWKRAWVYEGLSAPLPSWPEPARGSLWQRLTSIEARVIDDQAYPPLLAKDRQGKIHVLIASTANDKIISLNPVTGKVNWQFTTEAPIRYAPSIENGIAYFGADDGLVRAVEVQNGNLIWKTRVGPELPWIVGNGRLISPHPIRTSVVVSQGKVFAHAGLFPSQGVYSIALDQHKGDLKWRRKLDKSPQGYLLATDQQRVYVPTGRSVPYAVDAENGKRLFDLPSSGGSFCMLTTDAFFTGPGNSGQVQSFAAKSRAKMLSFSGRQISAGGGKIWTANGSKLTCHDMAKVLAGKKDAMQWSVDSKAHRGMIVSGTETNRLVFAAVENQVHLFRADSGKQVGKLETQNAKDAIVHLAVSAASQSEPETLVATTQRGTIYCWHGSTRKAQGEWARTDHRQEIVDQLDGSIKKQVSRIKQNLKSNRGFGLIVDDPKGILTSHLVRETELHYALVVDSKDDARDLRSQFEALDLYGTRVSVFHVAADRAIPFADELFNLVVIHLDSQRQQVDLQSKCWPGGGVLVGKDQTMVQRPALEGSGIWRHQYASPSNHSDSKDTRVGDAAAFRLQWFGGVGPSRMPDRHLRGPAPLCAGSAMIMQADGGLIGVDPANGVERWHLELPAGTTRYVTPFDGGYACLNEAGDKLFVATPDSIWVLDPFTGNLVNQLPKPESSDKLRFGYLAETGGSVIVSLMKPKAPRTETDRKLQYQYVSDDYKSSRPLVTSRQLLRWNEKSKTQWTYAPQGVIPNGSISLSEDGKRIVLIEGRGAACINHETDRIKASEILKQAFLVCLDAETGKIAWEKRLSWPQASNVLYTQIIGHSIVTSTSESISGKAVYHLKVSSLKNGNEIWSAKHDHLKGGLGHGEQVHHPVTLERKNGEKILVAEPYFYQLKDGKRTVPKGVSDRWGIRRPGHSCGTLSAAGNCLFFRANNPTVLNLNHESGGTFTKLAPSRPGCWINMIPVAGRLVIPEASASCVCKYSLQTSMSFVPIRSDQLSRQLPVLKDVIPTGKLKK